jgi:hypothetical protein
MMEEQLSITTAQLKQSLEDQVTAEAQAREATDYAAELEADADAALAIEGGGGGGGLVMIDLGLAVALIGICGALLPVGGLAMVLLLLVSLLLGVGIGSGGLPPPSACITARL